MSSIIENVVYQHAESASSLWWQWYSARHEPHYGFSDLRALENRIDANLDGLLIAGDAAVPLLQELLEANDEGALFALAIHVLRKGDKNRFRSLLDIGQGQAHAMIELDSALAWVHERHLQGIAAELLGSDNPHQRLLGISACLSHQRDPGKCLQESLTDEDSRIRIQALEFAAKLGDSRLLPYLSTSLPETVQERHALAQALLLLGKPADALKLLEQLALNNSPVASDAMRLSVLSTDKTSARTLLRQLDADALRLRDVIRGFGLLGDPGAMEWLIERCNDAALGRLAGESIALITGVNLADNDLEREAPPDDREDKLNDDPADDHVALDEDENLAWPDAERVAAWWHSSQGRLVAGETFICGYQRSPESLRQVLHHGLQRQRAVAADLMAITQPGNRYCNTTLPTQRQMDFMPVGDR